MLSPRNYTFNFNGGFRGGAMHAPSPFAETFAFVYAKLFPKSVSLKLSHQRAPSFFKGRIRHCFAEIVHLSPILFTRMDYRGAILRATPHGGLKTYLEAILPL